MTGEGGMNTHNLYLDNCRVPIIYPTSAKNTKIAPMVVIITFITK